MKDIYIGTEEYYEDRLSNCCNLPIFFQTDICMGCENHTTFTIIKKQL